MSLQPTFEKNIAKLLSELNPRARMVIKRRYGLGEKNGWTLEAIGKKEGVTRERVRQIEADAIGKLRNSKIFSMLSADESGLSALIDKYGGVIAVDMLGVLPELASVKDGKNLYFFIDLVQSVSKRRETETLKARLHTRADLADKIEKAVTSLTRELHSSEAAVGEEEILAKLASYAEGYGVQRVGRTELKNYLALARNIMKNRWGEYGHAESPLVRPRGMREGAYVALARAREPLHFRDIAEKIGEFWHKPVHVQTVHNELIKDERFVLVGRGLYALREWGYEPGFVRQILVRLLEENGGMTKNELVSEILKRRQVKPSTVLINLQNKKLFKQTDEGTYTLIS